MTVQILEAPESVELHAPQQTRISGERATYKANNYLARHVSTCYGATAPELLLLDKEVWQVLVHFKTPNLGPLRVGFLDVDAETGKVISFTDEQIEIIRDQASAFVKHHTSSSTVRD